MNSAFSTIGPSDAATAAACPSSSQQFAPAKDVFDVERNLIDLPRLCAALLRRRGRALLTNSRGESCVLMTSQELNALEQALEILARSDAVRQMRTELAQLAMALR